MGFLVWNPTLTNPFESIVIFLLLPSRWATVICCVLLFFINLASYPSHLAKSRLELASHHQTCQLYHNALTPPILRQFWSIQLLELPHRGGCDPYTVPTIGNKLGNFRPGTSSSIATLTPTHRQPNLHRKEAHSILNKR